MSRSDCTVLRSNTQFELACERVTRKGTVWVHLHVLHNLTTLYLILTVQCMNM